jgi:hypothetical protein
LLRASIYGINRTGALESCVIEYDVGGSEGIVFATASLKGTTQQWQAGHTFVLLSSSGISLRLSGQGRSAVLETSHGSQLDIA